MIVALANSEVRLYNPKDKNLIHIMKVDVRTAFLSTTVGPSQRHAVWNIWQGRRMPDPQWKKWRNFREDPSEASQPTSYT